MYNNIINRAKSRILDEYTEKHHIIPKSLGGNNSKTNIVRLTAREHFICHMLLVKMTNDRSRYQMMKAADMMRIKNKSQNRYKINSRTYEILKRNASIAMSQLTKGKPKHTESSKKLLSESRKGKPSTFKGKFHTDENKKLLAERRSKACISPTGIVYSSTKEAGIAHNMSGVAIRGHIARGVSGWKYFNEQDQILVESKRKPKKSMRGVSQSKTHVENRIKSRLSKTDYYKNRELTIEKMSIAAKLKNVI
jgi:hypothetical protein